MDQLLQCPICLESQIDPRILPCLHSLCLRCLEKYVTTSGRHSSFPCPVCRTVCHIPQGGVKSIPKNFFLNNVKDILDAETATSSAGYEAGAMRCVNWDETEPHGNADFYCRECAGYVCLQCKEGHKKWRSMKNHNFVRSSDVSADEAERAAAAADTPRCEEHPHMLIDLFCDDCNIPTCTSCSILSHVGHKHVPLKQAAADCDQKLDTLADRAAKYSVLLGNAERNLKVAHDRCQEDIKKTKREIDTNADQLCRLIRQKQKGLQHEVDTIEQDVRKKFHAAEKELEIYKANVLSIQSYIEGLKESKQFYTKSVHTPGIEQQLKQQEGKTLQTVQWEADLQVHMKRSVSLVDLLGSVTVSSQDTTLSDAQRDTEDKVQQSLAPVNTMKTGYTGGYLATGLVVSGNHIYVTYIYDNNVWVCSKKGDIIKCPVSGMKCPQGMVLLKKASGDTSSNINLAITDNNTSQLYLVDVSPSHTVVSHIVCQLPYKPQNISVDPQGQLLILDHNNKYLDIRDRAGKQIRSIQLPQQLDDVVQAIATNKGYAVVGQMSNSVTWVDSTGQTLHTYGTHQHEELNNPCFVLQDSENRLVVCDAGNHRLHLIGPNQRFIQYLVTSTDQKRVQYPSRAYLDQSAGLLYVAHRGGDVDQVNVYKYRVSEPSPPPCTTSHIKMLCSVNKVSA